MLALLVGIRVHSLGLRFETSYVCVCLGLEFDSGCSRESVQSDGRLEVDVPLGRQVSAGLVWRSRSPVIVVAIAVVTYNRLSSPVYILVLNQP